VEKQLLRTKAPFFNRLTTLAKANLEALSSNTNISIEALEPLSKFISRSPAMQSFVEQDAMVLSNLVNAYLFLNRAELMQPAIEAIVGETGVSANELLDALDDVRDENIDESMRKCK
jgi:hypothetical protein